VETGILLIVDTLAPLIDRWRRDSWQSLEPPLRLSDAVPPHVTLMWPWHRDPHDENALRRLRRAVVGVEPFDLRFRRVAAFEEGAVFLEPDPSEGLDDLFEGLVRAFPEYPPYGGRHDKVRLHVTVSVGGGADLAAEVAAAGIDVTVHVDHVTVGVIAPPGRWEPLEDIPLSQAKDRG
jgi:2'-5' RNA ligase